MAIDWDIGIRHLQALGEEASRDQAMRLNEQQGRNQNQLAQYGIAAAQRREDARPAVQQRLAGGDIAGAQATAIGAGDFDLARSIAGLDDQKRKQLAVQTETFGRAAYALRRLPAAERRSAFLSMVPTFRAQGFAPEEMREFGADLEDGTLDGHISLSQSIRDHLAGDLAQARIDDVGEDNERADVLAEDTIRDRSERRALTARGQTLADERGRYGISVASADRRRGQTLSHEDRVRGQDRADARSRRSTPRANGGTPPAGLPLARTPAEARALPPGTKFRTPDGRTLVR